VGFLSGISVVSDPNALPDLKQDAPCDLCAFASSAMSVPPFNREPPSQPIDDPAKPILESQFMEIDQESQFESTKSQIREQLCAMNWGQRFHRLDLNDHLGLNNQSDRAGKPG